MINIQHSISLPLDTATFTDLERLVRAVPEDAINVDISTSTVARGQGYGEYNAVTLEVHWES